MDWGAVSDRAQLLKGRFELAKRMLVESRRGYVWGRDANWTDLPTATPAPSSFQPYLEEHTDGPGIWKWQHYFPIYDRHFAKFKGEEVHVVEIGIFSGGSLGMWQSYFGKGTHVYGVDNSPACKVYERPGVDVFIGDQADPNFWAKFIKEVPRVDIVIDDGGHKAHQQIATLEGVLPHIRPGGVYLCEDIVGEYNPLLDYLFGLSRNLHPMRKPEPGKREPEEKGHPGRWLTTSSVTDLQRAIESIHFYPWVVVMEKRDAQLDRFLAPRIGSEWQPPTFWKR